MKALDFVNMPAGERQELHLARMAEATYKALRSGLELAKHDRAVAVTAIPDYESRFIAAYDALDSAVLTVPQARLIREGLKPAYDEIRASRQ